MKGKIFNAQEVQAIIAGNKTQFREVIKAQPNSEINPVYLKECNSWQWATKESRRECPYQVGQKIFVKESFLQKLGSTQLPSGEHETFFTGSNVEYVADGAQERWDNPDVFYPNWWKKRPAQHMKQEQSRITLEITSIKVERLADISEDDAIKEGVDYFSGTPEYNRNPSEWYEPDSGWLNYEEDEYTCEDEVQSFATLWDTTRKKPEEKWEANPWVWVVDFKINK